MTRINLVPVTELCDQHLLAEFRELPRIPNGVFSGRLKTDYSDRAPDYVLGTGHIKFFTNKLRFLYYRYDDLYAECKARGFNVVYIFPVAELKRRLSYWRTERRKPFLDYEPTVVALALSRERIRLKMPARARFTKYKEDA